MFKLMMFLKKVLLVSLYSLATMQAAIADDTEIFFAPASSTATIKPNVLFAIDTSGSMTGKINGQSKISIVKEVMSDVLTDIQNVNAGLMRFNAGTTSGWDTAFGGPILYPVLDVDLPANPVVFKEVEVGSNDSHEAVDTSVTLISNDLAFGGSAAQITALRFAGLNIPQGAKIKRASISFTAKGNSAGPTKFDIVAQKVIDAPLLSNNPADISSRLATRTSVDAHWYPDDWQDGNAYVTPDLSAVVQEVVDQSGWCGGNNMVFLIEKDGDGPRVAYSAEGEDAVGGGNDDTDPVTAARIKVEYFNNLPSSANGCYSNEVGAPITQDSDDAEVQYGDWSSDLDFYIDTYNNNVNGEVALSFRNVNIPQNATIVDATISFVSASNSSNSASSVIYGVNDSTPPMGASVIGLSLSSMVGSNINWSIPAWTTDQQVETPSIAPIVQDIVNRGDWSGNGNMSFRLDGSSGNRRAYSRNGDAAQAAVLRVKYRATYTPGAITIRQTLKDTIQDLNATGYTPISDTIAEAGLYYSGGKVTFGISRDGNRYNRMSHELSYDVSGSPYTPPGCTDANPNASECAGEEIIGAPNYVSPIEQSCQPSHFVFLTDGAPTSHHSETEDIYRSWTGGGNCNKGNPYSDCSIAIAGYLNNNDLSPLTGKQGVTTHMIGFGAGADPALMKKMADAGGGGQYSAADKNELVAALTQIVASISNVNTTFVTTGVTVNQFNRLTHNEELYYSLFSPQASSVWPGNVKRYALKNGRIVDVNYVEAIDPLNSEFKDTAQSWWSAEVDGNNVEDGGAASKLTVARRVLSNIASNDLTAGENLFNTDNVTAGMLLAADEVDRKTIIHWAQGYDVSDNDYDVDDTSNTPPHRNMGDPLHSQPTLVVYNSSNSSKNKTLVYVGTNHGYLHAIDADDAKGTEEWAFIPKELMPLLKDIQKKAAGDHRYGIDGAISIYIDDQNNNGVVDVDDNEKAYLYVGMRRGGSTYYVLDISDPTNPDLLFQIDPSVSGYSSLGQTWSKPVIGKMDLPGVNSNKLVMIFGGGYDNAQDNAGTASVTDTVGNLIYIADAEDGSKLWDSSMATQAASPAGPLSSMNSVPSDVTAFDLDADGLIDHMYTSDTKAQVFRFDVDNSNKTITGGRIASLQSAADVANNRRFYYSPDAALVRLVDDSFVSVSIGSGYRAHPLDENITDYFYMIKDRGILKGLFDMDVTMDDLLDVTPASMVGDTDGDGVSNALEVINDEIDPKDGWYISFPASGEKVIERSITFNNAVIFTTYVPPGSSSTVCEAAAGGSRIYGLKIVDGNPYLDTNYDGSLNENDRYMSLSGAGIAPPPQVLLEGTDDGVKSRLCVGTQCGLEAFLPPPPEGVMGIRWRKF